MKQVALIIPYFGKWPEWMDLYLFSCSKQHDIDFIFYTDCVIPERIYKNTIFYQISFEDYCSFVSKRLSIPFHPKAAYKLCDLKVFYGIVHENDLQGYEWWGFGDIDLVYGDLSLLVNEDNLHKYDLLTTHVDRIAGHFTLIRKDSIYTTLCKEIPDWKKLLCDAENHGIDENAFSRKAMSFKYKLIGKLYYYVMRRITSSNSKHYWYSNLESLLSSLPSRILMQEFFTTFKPMPSKPCTYDLKTSEIVCPINQISRIQLGGAKIYLHFMCFKKTPYYATQNYWKDRFYKIPKDYDFSKGGIVEISTEGIRLI